jgi:cell surface hyaluronidase
VRSNLEDLPVIRSILIVAIGLCLQARAVAQPTVPDGDFEAAPIIWGWFAYDPPGTPWSFVGSAGVADGESGFTSGNPPPPAGEQVAFLQTTGSFSQTIPGWAAGNYRVLFWAAQRGNLALQRQDFQVLIDGAVVGTFTPTSIGFGQYATDAFVATDGPHTVTFQGLNTAGGDNTALVDLVSIVQLTSLTALTDAGFETPDTGRDSYLYRPAGTPWTFIGTSGISANGSGFTAWNPDAPEGSQVGFVQGNGTIRQAMYIPVNGYYRVRFLAAQRAEWNQGGHDFAVRIGAMNVGTYRPTDTSYRPAVTDTIWLYAGANVLEFHGLDTSGGDNTVFIDSVTVEPDP